MPKSAIITIIITLVLAAGLIALSARSQQQQSDQQSSKQQVSQEATSSMQQSTGKLEMTDTTVGNGPEVQPGATVTVHYTGTLEDGRKFDSSYDRGEPATFSLDQVIRGWQEGLVGMKVGGKRHLVIPGDMAYGSNPPPGSIITPNATLVFDVELLEIK
jgi:peptidylprolyl isomerase